MFEIIEKKLKTDTNLEYSHYTLIDGDRSILQIQIPAPKSEFTKDIYLKYQNSIGDLLKKVCDAMNKNGQVKSFGRNYDDFIYVMSGSSAFILYEDGVDQFGYANTGSPDTTEKFVRNFLSLLASGKQLFNWNECYMVVEDEEYEG